MTDKELYEISGGASISASLLNSLARGIDTIYNLGRAFGTAIQMIVSRKICK